MKSVQYNIAQKGCYAVIFLIIFSISNVALAQKRWSVGLRPAVGFTTEKLGGLSAKTGIGFDATVGYRFMPHLEAYGGWSWNKFPTERAGTLGKLDFEETGYCYGFRFIHPIHKSRLSYLIRMGGLYNHIEVEDAHGNIIGNSGHGFGWELEGGLVIPLKNNWYLTPGVRYRSLTRDVKMSHTTTSVDLKYISAGIDLSWRFGK